MESAEPSSLARNQQGSGLAAGWFEGLNAGVILIDHTRKVTALTSGAQQILGSALPEPIHRARATACAVECFSRRDPGFRSAIGPSDRADFRDALSGWMRVDASLMQDGTGRRSVVLVLSDWTPIREAEQQLVRLDRLANLGTFAAAMAHEVKNALVPCKTFVDLLLEKNGKESWWISPSRNGPNRFPGQPHAEVRRARLREAKRGSHP